MILNIEFIFITRFCAGGIGNLYHDWFAGELPLTLDELTRKSLDTLNSIVAEKL